jgi:hypothetical protein
MRLIIGSLSSPAEEVIVYTNFLIIKDQNEYIGVIPLKTNLFSKSNSNLINQKMNLLKEIEDICHFLSLNMNITPKNSDFSLNLMIRGKNESDLVIDCQTAFREIDRVKSEYPSFKFESSSSPLESIAFPLKDVPDSKRNVDQHILEIRSKYRFFIRTWIARDILSAYRSIVSILSPKVLDVGSRVKYSVTLVPPALSFSSRMPPKMTMHKNWLVGGSLIICSSIYNRLKNLERNVSNQLCKENQNFIENKKTLTFNDLAFQERNLQHLSIQEVQVLIRELQLWE